MLYWNLSVKTIETNCDRGSWVKKKGEQTKWRVGSTATVAQGAG